MTEQVSPFSLEQIGSVIVRFSSKGIFETHKDQMVDPYAATRMPKEAQVEGIQYWPQQGDDFRIKNRFPSVVILHERWGLTSQIKDLGRRLACEGYVVLIPNLYGRQGGMITANAEVADTLMSRVNEEHALQDINACCEFLNANLAEDPTTEFTKRNIHAVVGFGMGGSLAIRFACHRKRLRAAVAFYGKSPQPADTLKQCYCPLLYHAAGSDEWVTSEDLDQLRQAAKEYDKQVDVQTYDNAPHGFCNDTRAETYRADAADLAWERTLTFLTQHLKS